MIHLIARSEDNKVVLRKDSHLRRIISDNISVAKKLPLTSSIEIQEIDDHERWVKSTWHYRNSKGDWEMLYQFNPVAFLPVGSEIEGYGGRRIKTKGDYLMTIDMKVYRVTLFRRGNTLKENLYRWAHDVRLLGNNDDFDAEVYLVQNKSTNQTISA